MALSHLGPVESQQVVMSEHLNAVVVPVDWFGVVRLVLGSEVYTQTDSYQLSFFSFSVVDRL